MELKIYLRTIMKRWWIVVPTFLITLIATLVFTFNQTPVYESTATFIVKLDAAFQDDKSFVSALDILSRRVEIASTYAEVASSRLIKNQAINELGLSPQQRQGLSVTSRLVPGTNVLEITGRGPDPTLVRDFTNAVGAATIVYIRGLYETYKLEPLDAAARRSTPSKPNTALNVSLGAILGLFLGVVLAFLVEYLREPGARAANFDLIDTEIDIYNRRYFTLRLLQEMSRAKRNNYLLSVVLLNVDYRGVMDGASPQIQREALRKAVALLEPYLRPEDVMARFDETIFALLLPDVAGATAKETIERLQTRIDSTPLEIEQSGIKLVLHSGAGIVAYPNQDSDKDIEPEELLAQAENALKRAEAATYGKVYVLPQRKEHPVLPASRPLPSTRKRR